MESLDARREGPREFSIMALSHPLGINAMPYPPIDLIRKSIEHLPLDSRVLHQEGIRLQALTVYIHMLLPKSPVQ